MENRAPSLFKVKSLGAQYLAGTKLFEVQSSGPKLFEVKNLGGKLGPKLSEFKSLGPNRVGGWIFGPSDRFGGWFSNLLTGMEGGL